MSRLLPPLSRETRALLDQERAPLVQPLAVRLRAVARARASLTASPQASTPVLRRALGARWFLATALTCAAAAAAGATAYELRVRFAAPASPAAGTLPARSALQPGGPRRAPVAETDSGNDDLDQATPAPTGRREPLPARARPAAGTPSRAEAARSELRLLRQARGAVAREDFASALGPIAEHGRRFASGRLAEEREALRVKALAGLGRLVDARRAAEAFKVRFPRSVLLPAVSRLAETAP